MTLAENRCARYLNGKMEGIIQGGEGTLADGWEKTGLESFDQAFYD